MIIYFSYTNSIQNNMKMSAYKMTKNQLILQLFWQTEIGAYEAIAEQPLNHDKITSLKDYMFLIENSGKSDLSSTQISKPVNTIKPNTALGSTVSEKDYKKGYNVNRNQLETVTSLNDLKKALETFDECSLKNTASQLVFSDGNPDAKIMMIGEAPGKDEDRIGIPFVGQAGQLLDKMLKSVGLNRQQIYITNFIPWRPPGNRTPTHEEINQLMPFVLKHIQLKKPEVIVALGGVSAKALVKTELGILKLRGAFYEKDFGLEGTIRVLPTLHPAYLLRAPAQKKLAFADFVKLKRAISADPHSNS